MRAVIIDDIEAARISLAEDLETYCPQVAVVGEASGVRTGVRLVERLRPDLLFLDIELEDGTGFDLLEQLRQRRFKLIFTTASDSHGIRAIKFSALDYLLKPVDPDELIEAVDKAAESSGNDDVGEYVGVLQEHLKVSATGPKRIALNTADRVHVVNVDDVIRCESRRNYTLFHLTDNRRILVTRTLKEFDEMLTSLGFFRTHHSHLINLNFLREYVKGDGGHTVMIDGSEVPVAVRRKDTLLQKLGS